MIVGLLFCVVEYYRKVFEFYHTEWIIIRRVEFYDKKGNIICWSDYYLEWWNLTCKSEFYHTEWIILGNCGIL